jgi:hypothetical protein
MDVLSMVENAAFPNRKDLRAKHVLYPFFLSEDQSILFEPGISGNHKAFHSPVKGTSFSKGDSYHEDNAV